MISDEPNLNRILKLLHMPSIGYLLSVSVVAILTQ